MKTKEQLYRAGLELMEDFCSLNKIKPPKVESVPSSDRRYHLGSCAYYRASKICIMVGKCASPGMGGMAWSWPGYAIDRTPYGVIQHELGHHVDEAISIMPIRHKMDLFSYWVHDKSKEQPLTGYLGTDGETKTFYMEWFAENFRLFVTNPDLCLRLRPKFHNALIHKGINPLPLGPYESVLRENEATERIIFQACKKVLKAAA